MLISPYIMHRDTRAWSSAKHFLPERWLVETGGTLGKHKAAAGSAVEAEVDGRSNEQAASGSRGLSSKMDQGIAGAGMRGALSGMGPNGAIIPPVSIQARG